jgi:hypothetical protein
MRTPVELLTGERTILLQGLLHGRHAALGRLETHAFLGQPPHRGRQVAWCCERVQHRVVLARDQVKRALLSQVITSERSSVSARSTSAAVRPSLRARMARRAPRGS